MGLFGKIFGKKSQEKTTPQAENAQEIKEIALEKTEAELDALQSETEQSREQLRQKETQNVLENSISEQYELVYRFNLANHLAQKTGRTPRECFIAIERAYSKAA